MFDILGGIKRRHTGLSLMCLDEEDVARRITELEQQLADAKEGYFEGNSIQHWVQKAKAYKKALAECWDVLNRTKHSANGKKSTSEAIQELVNELNINISIRKKLGPRVEELTTKLTERDKLLDECGEYVVHKKNCPRWHYPWLPDSECNCGLCDFLTKLRDRKNGSNSSTR